MYDTQSANSIITRHLSEIERHHKVTILWAVENGSRAWGFESPDSDYDVRFVFYHPQEEYTKIRSPLDQVHMSRLDGSGMDLDFVGFDILKFSRLLIKTNPNMIEWCKSSEVYRGVVNPAMLTWIEENFNPIALYNAYRSIAYNSYTKYIKSGKLNTYKKHLYVIRGILNALYVVIFEGIPPMKFNYLRTNMSEYFPHTLGDSVNWIFKMKREHKEREPVGDDKHMHNLERFYKLFFKLTLDVPIRQVREFDHIDREIQTIIRGVVE